MNYGEQMSETEGSIPNTSAAFLKATSALVGYKSEIFWTEKTPILDCEVELTFIIGKKGNYIKREKAEAYIFGHTIHKDVGERNIQLRKMKLETGSR